MSDAQEATSSPKVYYTFWHCWCRYPCSYGSLYCSLDLLLASLCVAWVEILERGKNEREGGWSRPGAPGTECDVVVLYLQPANPFAALGSTGAAFGGAGAFSFGAPTAAFGAPSTTTATAEGEEGGDDDAPAAEEECQAEFKPVVQLDEVETRSGEEDEEVLLDL